VEKWFHPQLKPRPSFFDIIEIRIFIRGN